MLLNAIIVSVPLAVTSFQQQTTLPVWLLLLGSSALCGMEWNRTLRQPEHLPNRDDYRLAATIGALLLLFVQWSAIVEFGTHGPIGPPIGIVAGCLLIGMGTWMRSAAIRQLAAGFRSSTETSQLVTHGIYATFRHPSETGLLLAMLGITCLLSAMWTAIVFLPVAYAVADWRVRLEEKELRRAFGEQHIAYIRQTSRGLINVRRWCFRLTMKEVTATTTCDTKLPSCDVHR